MSASRPFPVLLSLRLSRMPLLPISRTAALLTRSPLCGSSLACEKSPADSASLTPDVVKSASRPELEALVSATLFVSICNPLPCLLTLLSRRLRSSSTQPAGVGGTGPRLVPCPGGRRVTGAAMGVDVKDPSGERLRLCERALGGGGPGGGGGSGIPGSQPTLEGDRLPRLEGPDATALEAILPVEAARREAGARGRASRLLALLDEYDPCVVDELISKSAFIP